MKKYFIYALLASMALNLSGSAVFADNGSSTYSGNSSSTIANSTSSDARGTIGESTSSSSGSNSTSSGSEISSSTDTNVSSTGDSSSSLTDATSTESTSTIDSPTSSADLASSGTENPDSSSSVATTTDVSSSAAQAVDINLDIEGATTTFYKGHISVSPCAGSPSSTPTANAYCAIRQSEVSSTWSLYGDDQFLDSINGDANDYVNNVYWSWFSNLDYGQTSLDKHILSPNENILVSLPFPLKIDVATATPPVGSTDTVSVHQFGFDASYNGVWIPAVSSTVRIGSSSFPVDQDGDYIMPINTTSAFAIYASEPGFLDAAETSISPAAGGGTDDSGDSFVSSSNPAAIVQVAASGGSGGESATLHHAVDVGRALRFLINHQNPDGSFSSPLYTDWAAVAFGAAASDSEKSGIRAYLESSGPVLSSATDYERHAMALMSLGINPYSGAGADYIKKVVSFFDGTQVGDPALVNDDIFAVFPLINSGYGAGDPMMRKIASFIVSKQMNDGSWEESADLTAAGIQALSLIPGEDSAVLKARGFLSVHQAGDGGFGTSYGTSWAIQAIDAMGERPSDWMKNGLNPDDYLYALQQADGGIEMSTADLDSRIWATSYAIAAALDKPWIKILGSFSMPDKNRTEFSSGGGLSGASGTQSGTDIANFNTSTFDNAGSSTAQTATGSAPMINATSADSSSSAVNEASSSVVASGNVAGSATLEVFPEASAEEKVASLNLSRNSLKKDNDMASSPGLLAPRGSYAGAPDILASSETPKVQLADAAGSKMNNFGYAAIALGVILGIAALAF